MGFKLYYVLYIYYLINKSVAICYIPANKSSIVTMDGGYFLVYALDIPSFQDALMEQAKPMVQLAQAVSTKLKDKVSREATLFFLQASEYRTISMIYYKFLI